MTVRICAAAAAILASAGCGASSTESSTPAENLPPVNVQAGSLKSGFTTMERLAEAAKREGELNVIALPRDWVNFGEVIDTFADKYGLKVNQLEPGASSRRQIEAAAQLKPDVFDLTLDVAVREAAKFAPYKVQGWQDLPDDVKDPSGAWYAAYGGYMSIGYDPRAVKAPASFADLLKPGYQVALDGDPLRSASAFSGVMAASMRAGVPRPDQGVKLFAELKKAGRLTDLAKANTIVAWDHLNAARSAGHPDTWQVTIPRDAALGGYHVQAINKAAPHPAAARLWQEFLFSDEGQNLLQKGWARPARGEAMLMKGTLDTTQAAKMPKAPGPPVLMTIPQADAAKAYLKKEWTKSVG
ncbi:putative spermidine/putrescine transport system substrate-binding protein [Nonomuraea polychroma]|uniref:Putative spermidine/putrescine transport system substrate-binding protein n=1 Tax=Nonomuraea polychroma TaxID=46176 RepID=A0A438MG28_9ACTN|nr:ABC transporter substrate-binding protein [Nonomuraea polychroma]RVX44626.1 putative spermidine/putrescine transport system substrate-binding protein [Nonomuraea polychroma]